MKPIEGEALKRRCTGCTASFGNAAIGERAKRGVVRGFSAGCWHRRRVSTKERMLMSVPGPRDLAELGAEKGAIPGY